MIRKSWNITNNSYCANSLMKESHDFTSLFRVSIKPGIHPVLTTFVNTVILSYFSATGLQSKFYTNWQQKGESNPTLQG